MLPVYVGDDTTDEDAFKALKPLGAVTVLVAPPRGRTERPRATHATHTLEDVAAVERFVIPFSGVLPFFFARPRRDAQVNALADLCG